MKVLLTFIIEVLFWEHRLTIPQFQAKESSARYMLTLIAVCTPYLLIFIVSVWRSLFGNIRFPSIFSIITVCVDGCWSLFFNHDLNYTKFRVCDILWINEQLLDTLFFICQKSKTFVVEKCSLPKNKLFNFLFWS